MQTFLPLPDYTETAKVLDMRRLGKQRVETWQILATLRGNSSAWASHPAVRMWKGYEPNLTWYGICICIEWRFRGYKDTMLDRFKPLFQEYIGIQASLSPPPFINNPEFHGSHRSALLWKKHDWYSQFGWTEEPKLNYYWPVGLKNSSGIK